MSSNFVFEERPKHGFRYGGNEEVFCFLNKPICVLGRRRRTAIIICPGGGFEKLEEREGFPVALRFSGFGFQTFVLNYRIGKGAFRTAIRELSDTVAFVRENADKWDIDPNKICVMGFSVGGFLSLALAGGAFSPDSEKSRSKPNALILGYPVVTSGQYAHEPSVMNSIDEKISRDMLSMEKYVDKGFPPSFIWGCADDPDVDIRNSIILSDALADKKVPFSLHIFPKGGHGLSLADETTARVESEINEDCSQWVDMAVKWLKEVL